MALALQPLTLAEANEFVRLHHRHHKPVPGAKFCIGANDGERVVGVAGRGFEKTGGAGVVTQNKTVDQWLSLCYSAFRQRGCTLLAAMARGRRVIRRAGLSRGNRRDSSKSRIPNWFMTRCRLAFRRMPDGVPVFLNLQPIATMDRVEYEPLIRSGQLRPVGTRRRLQALHYVDQPIAGLASNVLKRPDKTVAREHVGDAWYVFRHTRTAFAWGMAT